MVFDVVEDAYDATERLNQRRLRQRLVRVVAAFDEYVRLQRTQKVLRRVFGERDDVVDAAERREDLGPVFEWVYGAAVALQATHAVIAIQPDNEYVAEGASLVQKRGVPSVHDVETAV